MISKRSLIVLLAMSAGLAAAPGAPAQADPMKQLTRYHAKAPIGKAVLVAALGQHNKYCERLGGATINVTAPPRRGSVSTAERVEFVIKNSGDGNCVGMKANGTGVFYTAAAAGRDAFEFDAVFKNYTTHWIVDTVNN